MSDRITGPSRAATAEIIASFAATGRDDPTIARVLGITVAQVRGLRKQFDIAPGETRWTPRHQPGGRESAGEEAGDARTR